MVGNVTFFVSAVFDLLLATCRR